MDDIRGETQAGETQAGKTRTCDTSGTAPERGHRSVGSESEMRGGPEAPDAPLDESPTARFVPPDGMPGVRAGLPEGSLPGPYLAAQGDEDRTPPPNAPSPVTPAPTVATSDRDRASGPRSPTR